MSTKILHKILSDKAKNTNSTIYESFEEYHNPDITDTKLQNKLKLQ